MFKSIKIEKRRKELELIKEQIIKEKAELETIKNLLEEKCEKIDISDGYVFSYGGISYLVILESKDHIHYYLRDIFSKNIIFNLFSSEIKNNQEVYMGLNERYNGEDYYAYMKPILESNNEFLIYVDRHVPSYVLQQYLYKLNNININNFSNRKAK